MNFSKEKEINNILYFLEKVCSSVNNNDFLECNNKIRSAKSDLDYIIEMYSIIKGANDINEEANCEQFVDELYTSILNIQNDILFSNENQNPFYLEIHTGTGGDDAQDFSLMLKRMYIMFCEKYDIQYKVISESTGSKGGIRSLTMYVSRWYELFLSENGIHRLVRRSPFNSDNKRHTSFVSIKIYPKIYVDSNITLKKDDLKIDTFRASGAGGQHVNTTDSAVRVTYLPTGISVVSQSERSQHRNKSEALNILKSKLSNIEEQKLAENKKQDYLSSNSIDFGNQIRSYILHPYQKIKDNRTKTESSKVKDVFDGDIYLFMLAFAKWKLLQKYNLDFNDDKNFFY